MQGPEPPRLGADQTWLVHFGQMARLVIHRLAGVVGGCIHPDGAVIRLEGQSGFPLLLARVGQLDQRQLIVRRRLRQGRIRLFGKVKPADIGVSLGGCPQGMLRRNKGRSLLRPQTGR
jgi:hypothetical protein